MQDLGAGNGRRKRCCSKQKVMRTSLLWIQPRLFIGVGVRLIFGLQESTYLQQLSRLHMDSNLGLQLLHGKIIKSTLRRIQPHKEGLKEGRGGAKEQQRRPNQVGVPIQVELKSNSDSRNSLHQNHRPDHIPTQFWTFFI
jgi:hypothetical protein